MTAPPVELPTGIQQLLFGAPPPITVHEPSGVPTSLTLQQITPVPGETTHLVPPPDFFHSVEPPTWDEYATWAHNRVQESLPVGRAPSWDDIEFTVERASYDQLSITATFTNLLSDFILGEAIQTLSNDISLLQTIVALWTPQQVTNWNLTTTQNYVLTQLLPALEAQQLALTQYTAAIVDTILPDMERRIVEDTYVPLHQRIVQEDIERHADTAQIRNTAIPDAVDALDRKYAPVAALAATALSVANAAKTITEDCAQPMCDAAGGAGNFKKVWDLLSGLLGLLAGVEVAHLTEHDLESLAERFASVGAGGLETFMETFVGGGASVGDAAGAILGEITDAGAAALREIGVPV